MIERIELVDSIPEDDRLVARVRVLVAEGQISSQLGKELLALHRAESRDDAGAESKHRSRS